MSYQKKAIHTLRVNVKNLSYESTNIRQEIKKTNNTDIKNQLHLHRVNNVRNESRTTQLALAAVKNFPYYQVEKNAKTEPNWKRICDKYKKHMHSTEIERLTDWISEAQKYFRENSLDKTSKSTII